MQAAPYLSVKCLTKKKGKIMAQDFGDDSGEMLLRALKQAVMNAYRYHDNGNSNVVQNKTASNQEKICIPFGKEQDAAYFAAVCKENKLDVTALVDKKGNGYIEVKADDALKLNNFIPRYVEVMTKLQEQQIAERMQSERVSVKQRKNLKEVTKLPNLSDKPAPEKETPTKTEPAVDEQGTNHTKEIAGKVRDAREKCHDFEDFKKILAQENLGVGETVKGEVLIYEARLDDSGELLPYDNSKNDWAVGADKLKKNYDLDITYDWFEENTPKGGGTPPVPNENEMTHKQQEQTVSDGSMDVDGSTPDINDGIESHDSMDTDTHTARMEKEGNGTDIPMSEVHKETEPAADLEMEAPLMRDSSKALAGGDAAPDHDLSKFMQPER